jgi:hypothetical protein
LLERCHGHSATLGYPNLVSCSDPLGHACDTSQKQPQSYSRVIR